MKHRTVCATFAVVSIFSAGLAAPVVAAPSETDVANARAHEQSVSMSLSAIELELTNLSTQSTLLETQAQQAQEDAEQAAEDVYQAIDAADQAENRAEKAQEDVDEARAEMAAIAQAMYRDSASDLTNVYYFFDADSLDAAHKQTRAYSSVISHTDHKAQEFKTLKAVADSLQKQADAALKESQQLADAAEEANEKAQQAADDAEAQVQEAATRREELAVQLAAAKNTTVELENERLAYAEEQRQAQIEAQKQAAKEAKEKEEQRKTAEAARQAAVQASQPKASSVTPAASPAQPAASQSSGSAKRAALLAYARQFDGVPYVWGGTSPTKGWDCSGFVQYVHRQFGINLPRGGDSQGRSGRQIPRSEAEPGDLVWWPGQHVALYAGGNRVYASHRPGVPTGEGSLYGSYVFVRIIE